MIDREIHLPVAAQPSIDDIVAITQRAEENGYVREIGRAHV